MPFRRTLLLAALLPVAGCHSQLGARSNKLDSYPGDPARALVVVGNRLLPGASNERFQSAVAERLAQCGSAPRSWHRRQGTISRSTSRLLGCAP